MLPPFELDTHTHTIASGHAYGTIREMAQAAAERGLTLDRRVYIEFNDLLLTRDGGRACLMRLIRSLVVPPPAGKS